MSALAYSTDRAGCVSHPTPTRRCTHVGQEISLLYYGCPGVTQVLGAPGHVYKVPLFQGFLRSEVGLTNEVTKSF